MENTAFSLEHTDIPSVYKHQIGNERAELLSGAMCGRDHVSPWWGQIGNCSQRPTAGYVSWRLQR